MVTSIQAICRCYKGQVQVESPRCLAEMGWCLWPSIHRHADESGLDGPLRSYSRQDTDIRWLSLPLELKSMSDRWMSLEASDASRCQWSVMSGMHAEAPAFPLLHTEYLAARRHSSRVVVSDFGLKTCPCLQDIKYRFERLQM